MPPSPVAGRAGAVRIQRLDLAGIARAEKHGKRLDWSSMQRRVRSIEPLIWPPADGLELMARYDKHVAGVFIPAGDTKMLHHVVQFPKDLISEDEPERMLSGALAFMERIYGPRSVVCARVDQDEKGRHIVDCFVTPIYEKKTKRATKLAVSTTKHLKDLALKQGLVDQYNQQVAEKHEARAALRVALIKRRFQARDNTKKEGKYERDDITRLFTRTRRSRTRRVATAAARMRGLSVRALVPGRGEWDDDLGLLVRNSQRDGLHQDELDHELRYQDGADKNRDQADRSDHPVTPTAPVARSGLKFIDKPNMHMCGVALQTAFYEFLRDQMQLEGVQRGATKRSLGTDWVSAERLDLNRRAEELAETQASISEEAAALMSKAASAQEAALEMAAAGSIAVEGAASGSIRIRNDPDFGRTVETDAVVGDALDRLPKTARAQIEAAAEAYALIQGKKEAADADWAAARIARQLAEAERTAARNDAAKAASDRAAAAKARAEAEAAAADREAAAKARKDAESERQGAASDRQVAKAEREQAEADRVEAAKERQEVITLRQAAEAALAQAKGHLEKVLAGVRKALGQWALGKLMPVGSLEKPAWHWKDPEAESKVGETVKTGGVTAWAAVVVAAEQAKQQMKATVAAEIAKSVTPERVREAAAACVKEADILAVLSAKTEQSRQQAKRQVVAHAVAHSQEAEQGMSSLLREQLRRAGKLPGGPSKG